MLTLGESRSLRLCSKTYWSSVSHFALEEFLFSKKDILEMARGGNGGFSALILLSLSASEGVGLQLAGPSHEKGFESRWTFSI